jgi:hypothetical protein
MGGSSPASAEQVSLLLLMRDGMEQWQAYWSM